MADSDNFKTDKYLEKMNNKLGELNVQIDSLNTQFNNLEDTLKKQVAKYKQTPTDKLKTEIQKNVAVAHGLQDELAKLEDDVEKNKTAQKRYTNALLEASKKAEQQSKQAERITKTLYENMDMVKRNTAVKKKQEKATEDATKKVQQQNQEANKQQKVQKQVTEELENYLKELKKRPDYKEINKGGAVTNAYTRSGGDFDKFKKLVEDRINRLARKDQSSQSELQKIKTAEIHTKSSKQNKEAVQEENKGNATNVINEAVSGKTPDNETVVKTNKEREKALQNLEDYNKVFANIGSEEITLRQRILENTELYAGHLSGLVEANGKLVDAVNAQVFYGRQFATVLAKAVRGVGRINLPRSLGNLDIAANQLTEKLNQTKVQPRVKQAPEDSEYGSGKQALEEEVRLKSGKPRGSFKDQENKNQRRQEQKGFIALLIPALAKLLKKSPIWDAIKLLLLKFGKNHPLLTAGALMAGPALMAGGIGMKLLGGLGKGAVGGKVAEKISNIPRAVSVLGSKYSGRIGSAIGSAENKAPGIFSDLKDLYKARMDVAKAARVSGRLEELHGAAKYNANFAEQALHRARNAKGPRSRLVAAKLQNKEAQLALSNVNQQIRTVGRIQDNLTAKLVKTQEALTEKYLSGVQKVFGRVRDGFRISIRSTRNFFDGMSKGWKSFTASTKEFFNTIKSAGFKGNMKAIGQAFGKGAGAAGKGLWAVTKPSNALKTVGKFSKGAKFLGPLGIGLSALAEVPDLYNAATSGKPGALKKQLAKSGGGVGGAIVGAGIGATLGTALGPVGTVLGGILGSIIGDIVGRIVGPALMDGFGTFTKNIGKDFKGMWDGIKATMRGLGNVIGPIARLLGRLLVPAFKVLGAVLGGFFKAVCWGLNVILKAIGWVADTIGNIVTGIESAFKSAWASMQNSKNPFVKLIVKGLKGLFGTSGDKDSSNSNNGNTNGSTAGNAANTAASTGGGSSAPAKQGNTNFDKLVQEEREKMKKEGTDEILKDPNKVATFNAIQRLDKHTTNGINNTVDMRDLGLYGRVDSDNSKPYIPQQNALKLKNLDDTLAKWGYGVVYTSNMGGNHANGSGHYSGNKVDLQLTKNGKAAHLTQDQLNELQRQGYWGNGTGAVGWEAVNGQVGGGHYDLYVAPGTGKKTGTNTGTATGTATSTSTAVNQQTDDGVRQALLDFAAAKKKDSSGQATRDLIFQATDVTGSLGCWGITHVNNTGQMIH